MQYATGVLLLSYGTWFFKISILQHLSDIHISFTPKYFEYTHNICVS